MIEEWLSTTWTEAWLVVVSSVGIFVFTVVVIRINGLRTLAKMSSFDFAVTVAIGSLIATIAVSSTSLVNGMIALTAIVAGQRFVAVARRRSDRIESAVDNQPLLLVLDGEMVPGNMVLARVTESDVRAKLREANVLDWTAVRAVVFETTGDISVLHGESLDRSLLVDVRGAEAISGP